LGRDDDETQHKVILTEPFALGKYLATVDEFSRFMDESSYQWESGDQSGDRHPVIQVSHDDAVKRRARITPYHQKRNGNMLTGLEQLRRSISVIM